MTSIWWDIFKINVFGFIFVTLPIILLINFAAHLWNENCRLREELRNRK